MDEEMSNSRVKEKDILLNITGASIGRSAVYKNSVHANVNQHVCIIRPKSEIDSNFIHLNITTLNGQQQIDNNQAGGGREGLNFKQIAKIVFYFPTLQEQNAISNLYRHLDAQIVNQQVKLDNLKLIKAALLQKMFV